MKSDMEIDFIQDPHTGEIYVNLRELANASWEYLEEYKDDPELTPSTMAALLNYIYHKIDGQ